jgi:hypothetical protein
MARMIKSPRPGTYVWEFGHVLFLSRSLARSAWPVARLGALRSPLSVSKNQSPLRPRERLLQRHGARLEREYSAACIMHALLQGAFGVASPTLEAGRIGGNGIDRAGPGRAPHHTHAQASGRLSVVGLPDAK